jgi:phosphonopyruvate decarboxylase
MLDTNKFINQLISNGYSHLCVVPCSFVTSLINAAINLSDEIEYVPCASEAVACSVAAGLKMSGKRPIVIAQSSGLTNMGSCITSLLKPYEIKFPIIVSWRTYKQGNSEIQHKHLAEKLPDLVEAYGYKYKTLDKGDLELAIKKIRECEDTNQICLLEKDTFSKVDLLEKHQLELSEYPQRSKYMDILNTRYKDTTTLLIGTTGNTAREMYSFMPDTNNFYMAGNMGGALSVGLGAAKAGKKVVVCGGDAEFVMHMGGLTTAGRYAKEIDLTYILFDNESNKSTGGQNTYQDHVEYSQISKHSGFQVNFDEIKELSSFDSAIEQNFNQNGLRLIVVKCGYDDETPRPPIEVVKRKNI